MIEETTVEAQIEQIKKVLLQIEDALTVWQESPYVAGKLDSEERERYTGFLEGVRLSKAHVIGMRLQLEDEKEE